MLDRPFIRGTKGRSLLEHERNLLLGHCYAATPSRNTEIRELVWAGVEIWEIARGAEHPIRRWPIEALLCGEVALDESHVMFITVGRAVPTKSDEFRSIAVVDKLAERFARYAQLSVEDQLENLKYLRYRARRRLPAQLSQPGVDLRGIELLIDGERLTLARLERESQLFNHAWRMRSPGQAKLAATLVKLDESEAVARA